MASAPGPLAVAEAERDHIASLVDAHRRDCPGGCGDCDSLAAHLDRARRQAELLAAPETGEMFGTDGGGT